jgi:acetyl-CoA synthetase
MAVYEEYYKEVRDPQGNLIRIEINKKEDFNFAYDVVDRIAKKSPDRIALVHRQPDGKRRVFTYGDLRRLSDKAANGLKEIGIGRRDPVLLLLKRRYEFWIIILALHKLGAVAVPTSHMVSSEDIRERVRTTGAKAIICVNDGIICSKAEEALKGSTALQLVVGAPYKDWAGFERLMEQASELFERVDTRGEDDMLYYFTSGTNGAPKAVIHDFFYPLAHIYTAKNWHGIRENDLHITIADSGWAKSAWGKLYGQWFLEAAILVYDYEQFYAADMLKVLAEEKVNTFCAPPTIYKYFLLEDLKKYDLSSIHDFTTAGETLPGEVADRFGKATGRTIREGFGQTETALLLCTPDDGVRVTGSMGKPSPLYHIELWNEENRPVEAGEEGEIVILPENRERPVGVFKGYLGDEESYAEVWAGGVYHTRDMAYRDHKGNYFFVGRNDDVIKSSGYRIGPSEVEDILLKHPAVFECAVTAYPSGKRGSVVKASIVLREGYTGDTGLVTQLQDFVKKRAAVYKYPRMVRFVDSLPKNSNGKICRSQIRKADSISYRQSRSG